jgi:HK97 family phage major capsid protein
MAIAASDTINEAAELKAQALTLLTNPNASAEDIEKAGKLITDAEEKARRSKALQDLHSRASALNIDEANEAKGDHATEVKAAWKKFGNFLTAVKAAEKRAPDPRLSYFEGEKSLDSKDLAEGVGSTGGYLVPDEFVPSLMQEVAENSIVRSRAMVIPMGRRSIEVPALKQDGTTAGQPHWFGGMLAFWEAEAATMSETEPAFRNITLTAHELNAVTHVSNNLLADSAVSLAALLTGPRGFPGVIAWKEDYAFFNGSGVGEPLGVLNAGATKGITRNTSSTIKYDDLVNMLAAFMPSGKGVWVASIAAKGELLKMAGPTATNFAGAYLWGNAEKGIPDTLLGIPIIFSEKVPALGSKGDIGLYDFGHYYIGDRQSTTVESSEQVRWLKNQTSWKVTHRVDGQPWLNAPFTLADGATQISPFVVLNA